MHRNNHQHINFHRQYEAAIQAAHRRDSTDVELLRSSLSFTNASPYNHPFIRLLLKQLPVERIRRVPAALSTRRRSRIVVTGGTGFVGSHLVIDNFFTGRKDNLVHLFGNPRFELIRHDVVKQIVLEVDQIYHLARPAFPVHYKYNPIKTIIYFPCPSDE